MNIRIISVLIFSLLTLSTFALASADSMTFDSNNIQYNVKDAAQKNNSITSKTVHQQKQIEINLSENVGITTSDGKHNEQQHAQLAITQKMNTVITLSETFGVFANNPSENIIAVIKQNDNLKTTMERIANTDTMKFNGKSIVVTNAYDNIQLNNHLIDSLQNKVPLKQPSSNGNPYVVITSLDTILDLQKTINYLSSNIEKGVTVFSYDLNSLKNALVSTSNNVLDSKNPVILLALLPLSGYILVRCKNAKFPIFIGRQVVSFCFIVLLLTSIVVTPISISPYYWKNAYAETDNTTNSVSNATTTNSSVNSNYTEIVPNDAPQLPITNSSNNNSSTIAGQNPLPSTTMVATSSDQISIDDAVTASHTSNATNPMPRPAFDNSTFSEVAVINDTVLTTTSYHGTNPTTTPTEDVGITDNATISYHTPNPTASPSEYVGITDTVSAGRIVTIPNATQSWQFGSTNETKNVGDIQLQKEPNGTSLKLDGSGYLTQNVNSTRNLSALTLSAWIKPDYSQGSPQFTVLSKENTFVFAVNNIIPPTKIAVFSVFDGIKWQTVESNTAIPEEWTHLVATFTGSSIAIYVNGNLESTIKTSGVLTVAVNGKLATKTVDSLSSDADIVIGGYYNSLRATSSNKFSGLIKDVKLYDSLLSPSQILRIYEQNNSGPNTPVSNSSGIYNSTLVDQVSMTDTVDIRLNTPVSNSSGIYNSTLVDQVSMTDTVDIRLNTPASNSSGIYNSILVDQVSMTDTVDIRLNTPASNSSGIYNSTLVDQVSMTDTVNIRLNTPASNSRGIYNTTILDQISMIYTINQ